MSIINEFFEIGLMKTGKNVLESDEQYDNIFKRK